MIDRGIVSDDTVGNPGTGDASAVGSSIRRNETIIQGAAGNTPAGLSSFVFPNQTIRGSAAYKATS